MFLVCFLFYFDSISKEYLAYNRNSVDNFELWRLISANLLHTNAFHLLINSLAFLLIWNLYHKNLTTKLFILLFIFCSLGVTLGIHFFAHNINNYVGLSGVLHGVFIFCLYLEIKNHSKIAYLLVIIVFAKIFYEQTFGADKSLAKLINANIAIESHLYGVICALFFCLVYEIYLKYKTKKKIS